MQGSGPRHGTTVMAYGRPRSAVNFVAGAVARAIDPAVLCLEIREHDGPTGEVAEAIARRVGAGRTFVAFAPEEPAPGAPAPSPDAWKVLGPVEGDGTGSDPIELGQLPEVFRAIWSAGEPLAPRTVLVLNTDILTRFYPTEAPGRSPAMQRLTDEGVTFVGGRTGEVALEERTDEHVFRVAPHPDNDWTLARISTVRGTRWHFDDQPIRGVPLFQEYFRVLGLRDVF